MQFSPVDALQQYPVRPEFVSRAGVGYRHRSDPLIQAYQRRRSHLLRDKETPGYVWLGTSSRVAIPLSEYRRSLPYYRLRQRGRR